MVVSAQWPGATAEDMQSQVADRIESRLQDLPWLDYVQTYVRPGARWYGVLRDTTPPREVAGLWYQVRKKVGDIRHLLPAGVQGPNFDDEYSDVYAAVLALTGADNAELVRQAEAIRLRMLRLEAPARWRSSASRRSGLRRGQPRPPRHPRVPPAAILDALARHNAVAPAGVAETASSRVFLRTEAGFDGLAAIRAVPVEAGDGRTLRLGDIAKSAAARRTRPSRAIRHGGRPAVLVAVAKRPGADVLALGRELGRRSPRSAPGCPWASPSSRSRTSPMWWRRASASSC